MPFLQELIHRLEEGTWFRYLRISLGCLAVIGLVVWYNLRSYHNMSTQEGMDAAQVARNLAQGKGYSTQFVRPFSMHLIGEHNGGLAGASSVGDRAHRTRVDGPHPDLANAPVYPVALAGLMKVLPFRYDVDSTSRFWSFKPDRDLPRRFWRHQPDFLIALFNQALFFGCVVLIFFLTRKLFDATAAWTAAILLLGCEIFWRFSTSGLSTLLAMLLLTGLVWCLVLLEESARENKGSEPRYVLLGLAVGVLLALATLTRYSLGWLLIPVLAYLLIFMGPRRTIVSLAVLGIFLAVVMPWIYRNWHVSGTPFGTAGYAIVDGTSGFSGHKLERSLTPSFNYVGVRSFTYKFLSNSRQILQNDLPKLGGSWITPFFLVGLLLAFRNLAIRRLRYLLMGMLVTLFVVQALGRTQLSEDSPEINSENLLVLLVPFLFMYGVSLFFMLLDQMTLIIPQLRYAIIGVFGVIVSLPMIFTFLPPEPKPTVFPYSPEKIQECARWMNENEIIMSDMPWAVAWYGQHQSIWFTLNAEREFFALSDDIKPVRALYLTPQFMDNRFLSEWILGGENSWGSFVLGFVVRSDTPRNFPLRVAPTGFLPVQLFVTDWERWRKESAE